MRDGLIDPELITGPHITPQGRAAGSVDQAHDGLAINRCRDRLTELQIAKPSLLAGNFIELLPTEVVQVEYQEVVFQAGPYIRQLRSDAGFLTRKQVVVLRAEPADNVGLPRLESHHLRILRAHEQEYEFVQVWQPLVLLVDFPVIRIAFYNDPLPRHVLLEAERAQSGDLGSLHIQRPSLRKVAFVILLLQQMFREHRQTVEQSFGRRI